MRATDIVKLRTKIAEQREWIEKCGGSRGGYLLRYGRAVDADHLGDGGEAIWTADKGELDELEARLAKALS